MRLSPEGSDETATTVLRKYFRNTESRGFSSAIFSSPSKKNCKFDISVSFDRVPMLLAIVLVCKSSILWHKTATISWFSDTRQPMHIHTTCISIKYVEFLPFANP